MIRQRGISEKVVYAYNPLPAGTDDDFLVADGNPDLVYQTTIPAFLYTWKYGTGLGMESVDLLPGDFLPLRASEAAEFQIGSTAELGLCVVDHADPTHPETRKAALAALRKAERFYQDAGRRQLVALKKRHAYSEADMQDLKQIYSVYYRNGAREKAVQREIARLSKPAAAAQAAAPVAPEPPRAMRKV